MPFYVKDAILTLALVAFVFLVGLGTGGHVMKQSLCECQAEEGTD